MVLMLTGIYPSSQFINSFAEGFYDHDSIPFHFPLILHAQAPKSSWDTGFTSK